MDINRFTEEIEKLRQFSIRLKKASENNIELTNQLNSISKEKRENLFQNYRNANGPIKGIRRQVADILVKKDITQGELKNIINEAIEKNPESFKSMYKGWYNMLYMFLLADFRDVMNKAIQYISEAVIEVLQAKETISAKKFDFTGERETGSTRCWIAFINSSHSSQTTAKQLFLNIENGEIEYCFYDRPNETKTDQAILLKNIPFAFDDFMSVFKKHLQEVENDVRVHQTNYWRIGTSDSVTTYWDEMKEEGKICIGWGEIGDLNQENIKNKQAITQLLANEGFYMDDNKTKSRKAGEIFDFYKNIELDDIVLAQDGSRIMGVGKVTGDYEYNTHADFPHQRTVKWYLIDPSLINTIGLRTTVYRITDGKIIDEIKKSLEIQGVNSINPNFMSKNCSLNRIFFGPPGTGKTYNSITQALEIMGISTFGISRDKIKELFDRKVQEGQIVFTTFHQSMSYEDFIEGIKPLPPKNEGDSISYRVVPGLFKMLCDEADSRKGNFYEVIEALKNDISEEEQKLPITIKTPGTTFDVIYRSGAVFYIRPHNSSKKDAWYPVSIDNMEKYFETGNTNGIYNLTYVKGIITYLTDKRGLIKEKNKDDTKNYVFIIDEINRGNISAIFGELITLIEEDKRLGKEEALESILPYSKSSFGVPSNLYIIGTMNTADRSVEALDTALRRRFIFEEMSPKPELVSGYRKIWELWWKYKDVKWSNEPYASAEKKLYSLLGVPEGFGHDGKIWKRMNNEGMKESQIDYLKEIRLNSVDPEKLLNILNNRIEKLLDKDHLIGHSYFMSVTSLEDLRKVFYKSIIPLLQEYFFGDYGKIGLVLGAGFVRKKEWLIESSFANFEEYDNVDDYDEKPVYEIIKYPDLLTKLKSNKEEDIDFESAIKLLIYNKIE